MSLLILFFIITSSSGCLCIEPFCFVRSDESSRFVGFVENIENLHVCDFAFVILTEFLDFSELFVVEVTFLCHLFDVFLESAVMPFEQGQRLLNFW